MYVYSPHCINWTILKNMGFKHSRGKAKIVTGFLSETLGLSSSEHHMLSHWSFCPPVSISAKSCTQSSSLPSPKHKRHSWAAHGPLVSSLWDSGVKKCCSTAWKPGNGCLSAKPLYLKRSLISLPILQPLYPQTVPALSSFSYTNEPILEIRGFQQLRMWVSNSEPFNTFPNGMWTTTNFRKHHWQDKSCMDIHWFARFYWWFW